MSTEPVSTEQPVVPRMQLNPTVDPEHDKAVPSLLPDASPPAVADEVAAIVDAAEMPSATVVPRRGEMVEIPAKAAPLDADLEAEIEAALSDAGSLALGDDSAQSAAETAGSASFVRGDTELEPGAKVKGRVLSVHGDSVIVDVGTRSSGILPARNFESGKLPEIGTMLDLVVEKYDPVEGTLEVRPAKVGVSKPAGDWNAVFEGQIVDCMVTKTNKGGLEVNISNLRGFMPAGQVDLVFCQNLEQFVGQKLRAMILEVNQQKKNLVVSRRAFLEIAATEAREEAWKHLQVGMKLPGKVKTLKDYGVFVDVGGVDGLLHVSEISWGRIGHPKDVLSEGQAVEVVILSIDREKSKISLGMKQLQASPWQGITENYPPEKIVPGKVTKTAEFGAFVELEPGVEGMVHISELDHRRVHRVTDVLKVGQEIDVKILSVDPDKKRIALSIKALIARPEAAPKKIDEDMAPSAGALYERKRKDPLKGGGTGSGGMLFGNPDGS
ncbi:MAG: S1 RNA-binding domain-containing protein [Planctomycetaceae bacterium]|nr:S1 RNA-binding domain-containing protein [Planctomycetaceae bacterium]